MTDAECAQVGYDGEVRGLYPSLPPVRWWTNPALTWGNAFTTFDGTAIEVQLRDNPGFIKAEHDYTVWHESGHALAYARSGKYPDLYERYLAARHLPGPVVAQGAWATVTGEQFADDFWACHSPLYDPANGSQPAAGTLYDIAGMRAFFASIANSTAPVISFHDPAGFLLGYEVTSPFGPRLPLPDHTGIDLALPTGTAVPAVRGGQVAWAGYDSISGNSVIVHCPEGDRWWYAHLSQIDVALWQQVGAGQVLGLSGATGAVTGPHLHLEWDVWEHGAWIPVDPAEEVDMLSAETQAQIRAIVADEVAKGALGVATSVASGFNTTLPAELARVARGHDPRLPGNDGPLTAGEDLYPTAAK